MGFQQPYAALVSVLNHVYRASRRRRHEKQIVLTQSMYRSSHCLLNMFFFAEGDGEK